MDATLSTKIGSALIHAQEYMEPGGDPLDKEAFDSLIQDPEVEAWLEQLRSKALLPLKRSER